MQRWDVKYFLDTQVCLLTTTALHHSPSIKFIQQIAGRLREAAGESSTLAC